MSDDFNSGRAPLHWTEIVMAVVLALLVIATVVNLFHGHR